MDYLIKNLLKLFIYCPLALFLVIFVSCDQIKVADLSQEAADPDTYDMSVWEDIEPGIDSGFGSTDIAYSKSIPPKGNINITSQWNR
jgi:hypothetical protein